jgi:TadE-like protein
MREFFNVLLSRTLARSQRPSLEDSGQSLIETALALPLVLLLALNAANFGYFFVAAINLAAAPRDAVEYSVHAYQSPNRLTLPAAGPACSSDATGSSVSTLTYNDVTGVLSSASSTPCPNIAYVQVCTSAAGLGTSGSGATLTTNCTSFGTKQADAPNMTVAADPEAPYFLLNRVDIVYTATPLIPGNVFGIAMLPTYTFHRQVSMRQIN